MVVEVDLSGLRKKRMSQFSRDAVETMVQVGLEAVGVVDGIESCQDRKTKTLVRARAAPFRRVVSKSAVPNLRPPARYRSVGHLVPGRT